MPCEGGGRSPVKCRRGAACRWLDGPFRNYARRPSRAALSRRLAVLRFGVGSVRTHCGPGAVVHEYSHAIRNLPERPALLSISTSAAGVVNRWGRAITFSVWTRKPASKPDGANSAPCLPPPGRTIRVEHEYARAGALAYRATLFGRCECKTGIAPHIACMSLPTMVLLASTKSRSIFPSFNAMGALERASMAFQRRDLHVLLVELRPHGDV